MAEFRKDPITGRWVIVATGSAKRPSEFARQQAGVRQGRFCPFCPGNELRTPPELLAYRSHGARNEPGWSLRVVANKFPVLRVEGELNPKAHGLYDRMQGIGAHEVIIESPEHAESLADLPEKRIEDVFWAFRDRVVDLRRDARLRYMLFFKNHGEAAGQVLEHSHSQLIAMPVVPKRVQEELDGGKGHFDHRGRCVYCDIVDQERAEQSRVVLETPYFLAICPYAARFPFEIAIIPKAHSSHAETMPPEQIQDLSIVLKAVLRRLNSVLEMPPYNLVLHTAPVNEGPLAHFHWHLELIPKLTYTAGFELGSGTYLNPTPPEESARFLSETAG